MLNIYLKNGYMMIKIIVLLCLSIHSLSWAMDNNDCDCSEIFNIVRKTYGIIKEGDGAVEDLENGSIKASFAHWYGWDLAPRCKVYSAIYPLQSEHPLRELQQVLANDQCAKKCGTLCGDINGSYFWKPLNDPDFTFSVKKTGS
jgi:hypothetical protein